MRKKANTYYKRKSKIWPWGYYVQPHPDLKPGQWGHFVCATKEEAERQAAKTA
jgi:hypothetical protein